MSLTAQNGIFGFGPQSAKEAIATTFYRHKAADIDLGPTEDNRLGPAEIGGSPLLSFAYKAGYVGAGGATIYPRLKDTLGWLLYGALGKVTTTADTPESGMSRHEFGLASDAGYVPWMTTRKYIPVATGETAYGETFVDSKLVGLTLNFTNDAPLSTRLDFLARSFTPGSPSGWSWANTYEDHLSIPIGCVVGGYMKIPGYSSNELPIIGATVSIQNAPLDIRQEKVYGSPGLEDITIVGRRARFDVLLKWKSADLYRSILTGSASGTAWTAETFTQDFDIVAQSPADISGQTYPYQLRIEADAVNWQVNGPIRLAANQTIMMRLTGDAFEPASGDWVRATLDNEVVAYTWPT